MKSNCIAVIDSGVGGISTLIELQKALPNFSFVYSGDNKNAPYGEKSDRKLVSLCIDNLSGIFEFRPCAIVLACNTLSVSVREEIEKFTGIKTFGIFPSVHVHLMNGEKTLLLSTPKTAECFSGIKNLTCAPMPKLAGEIERFKFDLSKVNVSYHLRELKPIYDAVILGCTHYNFVKNQILDHLKPPNIETGNHFTIEKIKAHVKLLGELEIANKNQMIFIGQNASENFQFYTKVVNEY